MVCYMARGSFTEISDFYKTNIIKFKYIFFVYNFCIHAYYIIFKKTDTIK